MELLLILGGAVALMLLSIVWLARREGRNAARARIAETAAKRSRHALQIDEKVARLSDVDLDGELRKPDSD